MIKRLIGVAAVVVGFQGNAWAEDAGTPFVPPVLPELTTAVASSDAGFAELPRYARACVPVSISKLKCLNDLAAFCNDPFTREKPALAALESAAEGKCPAAELHTTEATTANTQSEAQSFTGMWQEEVIRGIASFLSSRAKAEALASVVDKLRGQLCLVGVKEEEITDRSGPKLFPATCRLLGDSEAEEVPLAWGTLKSAIESDFNHLPYTAPQVILPANDLAQFDRRELVIATAATLGLTLGRGEEPVLVLGGLRERYRLDSGECGTRPAECALLATGVVAQLIEPGIRAKTELTAEQWGYYLSIGARWYLPQALVAANVIARVPDDASGYARRLALTLGPLKNAAFQLRKLADSPRPSETPEGRLDRITQFSEAIGAFLNLPGLLAAIDPALRAQSAELVTVTDAARYLLDAADGVRRKDYARVLTSVIQLASLVPASKAPPWMQKYGGFLAEVASAKSSDDVQRALEAAAAPVGSWKHKRGAGRHAFTINGYVGIQGGVELFGAADLPTAPSGQLAVFGPVGIEASKGMGDGWSLGVFASVIDVGALVDVRLSDSGTAQTQTGKSEVKVDQTPTFGFAQVFSPGLYLVVGIPTVPVVFGAGAALSPQLRRVTFTGDETRRDVSTWRAGVFIAIDVTIFEL